MTETFIPKEQIHIPKADYVSIVRGNGEDKGVVGSEILPTVMLGQFHADELMLLMANRIESLEEEREELLDTIVFYADPDTYFGIGFLQDPPCGDFVEDCSDTGTTGVKPGMRARKALGVEE